MKVENNSFAEIHAKFALIIMHLLCKDKGNNNNLSVIVLVLLTLAIDSSVVIETN